MTDAAVRLVLVHHLNQYLITDGYEDRQGVSQIVEGYAAALRLHVKYGIPATLHLSGTLLEALAWHHPDFLRTVAGLFRDGLVDLVGGTYAENVMPLFPPDVNRAQLEEHLRLYERHLGCPPGEVRTCWVPERVWRTEALAPVLTDGALPNGGYRSVLLDDRLLLPTGGRYEGSPRETFDAAVLAELAGGSGPSSLRQSRPSRIAGGLGLVAIPFSTILRYSLPPRTEADWERLADLMEHTAAREEGSVLVYADDFERTSGVGGWDLGAARGYDLLLRWLAGSPTASVVRLSDAIGCEEYSGERRVDPGSFYELEHQWGAGEDYSGWWDSPAWEAGRAHLDIARAAVRRIPDGATDGLAALARKHYLASGYETAWHEMRRGSALPAAWALALASHARACLPIVAAAEWFAAPRSRPHAAVTDLDQDGDAEVVLAGERLFAVLSPRHGGRLVYLFALGTTGPALVVGNPSDDWNLQVELNRYMDSPPNHPGGLADVTAEHDRYEVVSTSVTEQRASVVLVNRTPGSRLEGTRKTVSLQSRLRTVDVRYDLPVGVAELTVDVCLSPDYLTLLQEGSAAVRAIDGPHRRGFSVHQHGAWVELAPGERTEWEHVPRPRVGHGLLVRVHARTSTFHVRVCGGAP